MIQTNPAQSTDPALLDAAALSPTDLARLDTYCFATPCDINAAAAAHGVTAAEFFLFIEQPHIADFVRRARAARAVHNFEVAADYTRGLITQPGNPIERRRAAASLLRACTVPRPTASAVSRAERHTASESTNTRLASPVIASDEPDEARDKDVDLVTSESEVGAHAEAGANAAAAAQPIHDTGADSASQSGDHQQAIHSTDPAPRELVETLAHALHADGSGPFAQLIEGLRTPAFTFKDDAGERRPDRPVSPADIPRTIQDACFDERLATTIEPGHLCAQHAIFRITAHNGRSSATMNLHFRRVRDDPHDAASARWRLDFLETT